MTKKDVKETCPLRAMHCLLKQHYGVKSFLNASGGALNSSKHTHISGMQEGSLAFLLLQQLEQYSSLKTAASSNLVVVVPTAADAQNLVFNLHSLSGFGVSSVRFNTLLLENESTLPYRFSLASPAYVQNLQCFYSLAFTSNGTSQTKVNSKVNIFTEIPTIVITHALFAVQPLDSYSVVEEKTFLLKVGDSMPASELRRRLDSCGYQRVMRVEMPGEYANRGELFDIFTPACTNPLRFYFFGDELEEVREFSAKTQSSFASKQLKHVALLPFFSLCASSSQLSNAVYEASKVEDMLCKEEGVYEKEDVFNAWRELITQFQNIIKSLETGEGVENFYMGHLRKQFFAWESFAAWLTKINSNLWVVDEAESLALLGEAAEKMAEERSILLASFGNEENKKVQRGLLKAMQRFIPAADEVFCTWEQAFSCGKLEDSVAVKHLSTGFIEFNGNAECSSEDGNFSQHAEQLFHVPIHVVPQFKKQLLKAKTAVQLRLQQGEAVCLLTSNAFAREKLYSIFTDSDGQAVEVLPSNNVMLSNNTSKEILPKISEKKRSANKSTGNNLPLQAFSSVEGDNNIVEVGLRNKFYTSSALLSSGFAFAGLHLFTDYEMFGKVKHFKTNRLGGSGEDVDEEVERESGRAVINTPNDNSSESSSELWLDAYFDLGEDDFVVHHVHGIGIFRGICQLTVEDSHKDYLKLEYADKSFLFVPVEQLSLVQKYVGGEAKMDKLGGKAWEKIKNRVAENTVKLARQLVLLYGQRAHLSTTPFLPDDFFQSDFEMQFPFAETKDQLKATAEIKYDLQSGKVMDRLLCADVGFGKTEVALRAIFKAVLSGFQVAFLVPTTILSQQHYRNFLERFKNYPVSCTVLSRHVGSKQKKEILAGLASGKIDVVVATHKLFSKQVCFKRLGLLVIDEEQKFGVKQKEALKEKYPYVNTLALSATPIPRTLHMSLSGVRKLSVIATPPHGRKAVDVHIMQTSNNVIRRAILREKNRTGQVFFVCPRIKALETQAATLQKLLPECSIAIAHGQMEEKDINSVMQRFVDGKIDVLIATAIVENGLDIPNANTLIVMDSHRFGLSQLYQLKGRVGRSNRHAAAYFFYPNAEALRGNAKKRLHSLAESTHIGAGFSLAMRDMEIRGAGNLLGPQQSGSIAAVGYEMYCRLLSQSIASQTRVAGVDGKITGRWIGDEDEKEISKEVAKKTLDETTFAKNLTTKDGEGVDDEGEQVADIAAFSSLPTSVDIKYDGVLAEDYAGGTREKIRLFRQIAAIETLPALVALTADISDRFGVLPEVIEKLIAIAKLRIEAQSVGVLSVVERSEYFEITFNLVSQFWLNNVFTWQAALQKNRRILFVPERKDCVRLSKMGLIDFYSFKKSSSVQKKALLEKLFVDKMVMLHQFLKIA